MEALEFSGWVEHIYEPTDWGMEFTVRSYENEMTAPKYPQCLKFTASKLTMQQVLGLSEGDRVKIKYYVNGKSGRSAKGYYCINRLNIAKDGGVTIVKRAPRLEEKDQQKDVDLDDIPF